MKVYVLEAGRKQVKAVQNELPMVAVGNGGRRVNRRSCGNRLALTVGLIVGVLFPLLFFGISFEVLVSSSCSSFGKSELITSTVCILATIRFP